jgi:hypothetical protein
LALRPLRPTQFDSLDRLPERPPALVPPPSGDPIDAVIVPAMPDATGSVLAPPAPR